MSTFFKVFLVNLSCFISTAYAESYIVNHSDDFIYFYDSKKHFIGEVKPHSQVSIPLPSYYNNNIRSKSYVHFSYNYDGAFSFAKYGDSPTPLYPYGGFILLSTGLYDANIKIGNITKKVGITHVNKSTLVIFTPQEIPARSPFEVIIDIVAGEKIKLSCYSAPTSYVAGYEMVKLTGTTYIDFAVHPGTSCVKK